MSVQFTGARPDQLGEFKVHPENVGAWGDAPDSMLLVLAGSSFHFLAKLDDDRFALVPHQGSTAIGRLRAGHPD
jgi:hypothetical protein